MSKITHTKGIDEICFEEDTNCIWDAQNGEFVTRDYYDKVTRLREKHKDYYSKSYAKEAALIKTVGQHDTKLAQKLLNQMPATEIKKET